MAGEAAGPAGFTLGNIFGGEAGGAGAGGAGGLTSLMSQLGPAIGMGFAAPHLAKIGNEFRELVRVLPRLRKEIEGEITAKNSESAATKRYNEHLSNLEKTMTRVQAIEMMKEAAAIPEKDRDPWARREAGFLEKKKEAEEKATKATEELTKSRATLIASTKSMGNAFVSITSAFATMAIGRVIPLSKELAALRLNTSQYNMTLREQITFRGQMGAEYGMAGRQAATAMTAAFAEETRQNLATKVGGGEMVAMGALPGGRGQAFQREWTTLYRALNVGRKDVTDLTKVFVQSAIQAEEAGVSTTKWFSTVTRTAERMRDMGVGAESTITQFDAYTDIMKQMGIKTEEVANIIAKSVAKLGGLDVQSRMKTMALLQSSFGNLPANAQKALDTLASQMFQGAKFKQLTGEQMNRFGQEMAGTKLGGMVNALLLKTLPNMTYTTAGGATRPTMTGAKFAQMLGITSMVEFEALTRQLDMLSGATGKRVTAEELLTTDDKKRKDVQEEVNKKQEDLTQVLKDSTTVMGRFKAGLEHATDRVATFPFGTPRIGGGVAVGAGGFLINNIITQALLSAGGRGPATRLTGGLGGAVAKAGTVPVAINSISSLASTTLGVAMAAVVGVKIGNIIEKHVVEKGETAAEGSFWKTTLIRAVNPVGMIRTALQEGAILTTPGLSLKDKMSMAEQFAKYGTPEKKSYGISKEERDVLAKRVPDEMAREQLAEQKKQNQNLEKISDKLQSPLESVSSFHDDIDIKKLGFNLNKYNW